MKKVLIVCMGNICRSPMAQVVMQKAIALQGLQTEFKVESAGTHAQKGERLDPRAQAALLRRGFAPDRHQARRVSSPDFESFDLLLAMDNANLAELKKHCPPQHQHKLHLFLEFGVVSAGTQATAEVPDPYYGNVQGFDKVLDLCTATAAAFLKHHAPG